jgi:hypothetical protein
VTLFSKSLTYGGALVTGPGSISLPSSATSRQAALIFDKVAKSLTLNNKEINHLWLLLRTVSERQTAIARPRMSSFVVALIDPVYTVPLAPLRQFSEATSNVDSFRGAFY